MILDRLDRAHRYTKLSPRLAIALNALTQTDIVTRPAGKYAIDGEDVFALVQTVTLKPRDQAQWEAHRAFIDVQYVHRGIERFGWANVEELRISTPFDEEKDVAFYAGDGDMVTVPAGWFIIFYPEDAHMPCLTVDRPGSVDKTVIKVRL